jgi:hypothetical protein
MPAFARDLEADGPSVMGTHPGYKPNSKLREKLFEVLADETAQTIIKRTDERARTQQWLIKNIDPEGKNSVGKILEWFSVVGILDGSSARGYRLAVGELMDIFELVQDGPMKHTLWDTLGKPVGRAVLAALLHGPRTGTELNKVGPRKPVGHVLDVLYGGHVVLRSRVGRETWWTLLEPGRYSRILGGMGLIVTHLGNQLASNGVQDVRSIAYPAGHFDDYEPRALGARRPPETVPRPLWEPGERLSADQRPSAVVWRDLADTGLADADAVAELRRSLPRIPRRPFPWADVTPHGTNYVDIPGIADALLQSLPPMPSGDTSRIFRTMAVMAGTREEPPPPSPSQIRGLSRNRIRETGSAYTAAELCLPSITWVGTHSRGPVYAATFDADTNTLEINFGWIGLVSVFEEWFEQPTSIFGWIQRTLLLQHVLKLVRCIVSHENEFADLVLDNGVPEITEDMLAIAAHWTTAERDELRRRVNQHRSAHVLKRDAAS